MQEFRSRTNEFYSRVPTTERARRLLEDLVFPQLLRSKRGIGLAVQRTGLGYNTIKRIAYEERKETPERMLRFLEERKTAHDLRLGQTITEAVRAMQESGDERYDRCAEHLRRLLLEDRNDTA